MKNAFSRIFRNKIARNAASLYVVQACRKLVPLFTIPYLARVLGPSGWGDVAFTLSMGDFIALFAEFGFLLSATREIAQNRHSPEACGRIAGGTLGAQSVLSIIGVLVACLVSTQVPLLRSHPKLLCAGLIYGVAQGMAPLWLFQGFERMTLAASLEVPSKISTLVAIFLFVHTRGDEWKVLVFQSFTPMVTTVVGIWMAHRLVSFRRPTPATIWRALRARLANVFVAQRSRNLQYRKCSDLRHVCFFAHRWILRCCRKAFEGDLWTVGTNRDAFYPRLSQLAAHSPKENERLTRISALIETACGLFCPY